MKAMRKSPTRFADTVGLIAAALLFERVLLRTWSMCCFINSVAGHLLCSRTKVPLAGFKLLNGPAWIHCQALRGPVPIAIISFRAMPVRHRRLGSRKALLLRALDFERLFRPSLDARELRCRYLDRHEFLAIALEEIPVHDPKGETTIPRSKRSRLARTGSVFTTSLSA